ncbi:MAG: nucleotidyl transferase AbiEii/AbiGii toxin family protein [Deferrisomatales bacterium]
MIQRFFPIAVRHYELPSLFAGKVHALLARPHAKGRDWYDLVWYRTEQRGLLPSPPRGSAGGRVALPSADGGARTRWSVAGRRRWGCPGAAGVSKRGRPGRAFAFRAPPKDPSAP